MKKFTLEFKKAVVDEYNTERYTMAQVAKRFGVSESVVYKWVHLDRVGELGIVKERVKRGSSFDTERMIELYRDGVGIRSIAAEVGCSPMTVKFNLLQANVYKGENRPRSYVSESDSFKEAERLYTTTDMKLSDIASATGISCSVLRARLSQNGIHRPRKFSGRGKRTNSSKAVIGAEVVRDYNTGLYTHKDIADKYGVSTRTISRILADAGIESDNTVKMATASQVAGVLEEVKEDLSSGVDLYAICEKYNLPLHSVKKIAAGRYDNLRVTRSGEFAVSYYQPVTKKKVEPVVEEPVEVVDESVGKVIELHEKGLKISEMMRELGLTRYAITRILEDNGLDTKMVHVEKSSGTKSDRVRDDVLAAHNDGLGAADIAARCGVSIPTVRKVLREAGVVPHKHTVHDDAAGCGEGKPLLSAQQQEELNQVVDQVGSKAAEGIVSQEDTGP